ncbi:Rrf2 family transcriptional regulator [Hespellia stercorisuis]|uniref:Transcriptional regulator, BadM/Rrf2 family n=1 Tax=Hespellia stercorisuis DSM 15480 TaxID=1121950 RepID=A0A1M6I2P7_9FIRM|nr:Rrf2 family transcriptional regulator [Hespellia stercorisuis]SHJ28722.1 transcriptional regulator, BadM/Rrf2 family [Hespellia stercorisuis DSM 15480]
MQLTITTDYAIRIICLLAKENQMCSSSYMASMLGIPLSYIPKTTKILKDAGLIEAEEGIRGGYRLIKAPQEITLRDVIVHSESTMKINRCLERDGYCTANAASQCRVHKILLGWQEDFDSKLDSITIAELIGKENKKHFGTFYVVMKVDTELQTYTQMYAHDKQYKNKIPKEGLYSEFVSTYLEHFVCEKDVQKVKEFLDYRNLTQDYFYGHFEKDTNYRRKTGGKPGDCVWMEMKAYFDEDENSVMLSFHNSKLADKRMTAMEEELQTKDRNIREQYWKMVSLLISVLDHNQIMSAEHKNEMKWHTELLYRKLAELNPDYGITESEIVDVSHLAAIHDIGKIKIPIQILNKGGSLTEEEMELIKMHPLEGAEMTLRFPQDPSTEILNRYSYDICRSHHERYDGTGYPDGLKGDEIPLCAQVVGLVDVYDALVSERAYKKAFRHEEAIQTILAGKCGTFSDKLLQAFLIAAMQPEWMNN